MNLHERERLIVGVVSALVIHAAVFLGIEFAGLRPAPYSEITPVFVELPEYELPEPPPEEELPEPEPVEPEPIEEPPVEPEPVEPPPIEEPPIEPEPATEPVPDTPGTTPQQTSTETAAAPPASDATTYVDEALEGVPDEDALAQSAADRPRTSTDDLFAFNESPSETGTVPQEVLEVLEPIKTEAALDFETRASIDEKDDLVEGFRDLLNLIISELDNPRSRSTNQSTSGRTDPNATTDTDSLPGGSRLDWVGQGARGAIGELAVPTLSERDFGGGLVPAATRVIVFFDVNENGLVVPGSVFFRHPSGHGPVDGKIGDAVRRWRFEPSPGADTVTVICTLILEREE